MVQGARDGVEVAVVGTGFRCRVSGFSFCVSLS